MIIPIGDTPNPRGAPFVTWALIAINVLAFVTVLPLSWQPADPHDPAFAAYIDGLQGGRGLPAYAVQEIARQLTAYDLFVFRHGFKPGAPGLVDALTGMFLHGGWMHLLGNMLFLWIYGDNVEARLGRGRFLLAYLATGLAAVGGDALLRAGSLIPAVGASGAISGVLGLYFWWFPRNRVRLLLFFPVILPLEIPARIVLAMYLVVDNLLPSLFASGEGGGVAYGAHIGGFVAGLLIAIVADRRLATPRRDLPREAEPLFRGARSAAALGADEKLALAAELERAGRGHAALAAYQRLLADHARHPARAAAHLGAARVLLDPLGLPTSAFQHALSALEEATSDPERQQARALLDRIAQRVASVPRGTR